MAHALGNNETFFIEREAGFLNIFPPTVETNLTKTPPFYR
jgi:hypothetical protein